MLPGSNPLDEDDGDGHHYAMPRRSLMAILR